SLIGIIIGKYTGFAYLLNDGFEYFLNSFTRNVFFQNFSEFFSMYDIIFIILAVITAWEIPSKISKKKAVEANEADENIDRILGAEESDNADLNETTTENQE